MFGAITSVFSAMKPRQTDTNPATSPSVQNEGIEEVSCAVAPQPPMTSRTIFTASSCAIHGYPSSGGILIKDPANNVDLTYLSLPIIRAVERSSDAAEEDAFCERLRRVGATWWAYYGEWLDNYEQHDEYRVTAEQKRTMVYGWPTNGDGVWVLRYPGDGDVPGDLGRVRMARSMEERIEVMKGFGAEFVADPTHVEELRVPV